MKYRVKTQDGELEYESHAQLQQAFDVGFVDLDDQVLKEGATTWVAARTLLKQRAKVPAWRSPQLLFVYAAIALAGSSFWLFWREEYVWGATSLFLLVMLLFKITRDANAVRRR
ncbi:MAG TPA: hypothetical protein VGD87_09215 [Archangium sp.]